MYCQKCGELLEGREKFCPACGDRVERSEEPVLNPTYEAEPKETVLNPVHDHQQDCAHEGAAVQSERIGFLQAVKLYFLRYADFKGRSRRSEYWWATLGVSIIASVIAAVVPDLAGIWSLVTLVPSLALCVRRLHDIGKSGWSYLVLLIPVAGWIIMMIWLCTDSTEDNRWGKNPKA